MNLPLFPDRTEPPARLWSLRRTWVLARCRPKATLAELAQVRRLSLQTVRRQVRRLVDAGWLAAPPLTFRGLHDRRQA